LMSFKKLASLKLLPGNPAKNASRIGSSFEHAEGNRMAQEGFLLGSRKRRSAKICLGLRPCWIEYETKSD